MKKVLVTGGAGLIGAELCKKLLSDGYNVICVDNFITSSIKNIELLIKNPNFKLVKHDITEPFPPIINHKSLIINHIFHLACPTGVPNLVKFSLEMLKTCSIGTENVLEIARKHKATLVFTSSSEIYGNPKEFPQTENYTGNVNPIGIRSPYEEGKRFSESLIMSYVRKYKLDAKIVRVFNTYGPKKFDDTRVVTTFIKSAVKNRPLLITGNGLQTRTFCHVEDLVNALLIVNKRGLKGEVYNAGSDTQVSILELANLVRSVTNSKSKIKFIKRPNHDHQARLPDLSKIEKLGWKPTVGIYDGLIKVASAA